MTAHATCRRVGIVGGSGAGKTWLAARLQRRLGARASRLSLDDFYLDRSRLSADRRARINFDHPRAIDWPLVEQALRACAAGRPFPVPRYDFSTHSRVDGEQLLRPAPFIIVDGLWLFSKPSIRSLFDLRIYLDCPVRLRLDRRIARDCAERGRNRASVRDNFWGVVTPMHKRFVASQKRWAHLVVKSPSDARHIRQLARLVQTF